MANERLPDFIIGGAARSGTTWLYEVLSRHPGIFLARPARPEPKFFLVDETYEKGLRHYGSWFAGVQDGQLAGEKSTNYLESAVAASRIRRDLPRVKLIFILRDPVERAYSNFLWSRMNGLEDKPFPVALSLEEKRELELPKALRYARPHAYFSRGLYADLLRPYFDLFPREQLLCLKYEEIMDDPSGLIGRLHSFLDVSPRPGDAIASNIVNPSNKDAVGLPEEARNMLVAAYSAPNRRLAQLLGPGFKVWEY